MGGAVSKKRKVTIEERVNCVKKTPFSLYLKDETLREFALCFPSYVETKANENLSLNENIYIVSRGELTLSTTMPDPNNRIEHKGYLCKKYAGDISNLKREQELAAEKVKNICLFYSLHQIFHDSLCCNASLCS